MFGLEATAATAAQNKIGGLLNGPVEETGATAELWYA